MRCCIAFVVTLSSTLSTAAFAQEPAAPGSPSAPSALPALQGRPDAEGEDLLGGHYQNPLAGIAFRTPVNCKQVKNTGDEIVRFANEPGHLDLVVTRSSSNKPMRLTGITPGQLYRPSTEPVHIGRGVAPTPEELEKEQLSQQFGLLELTAARLKQTNPSIEMLRQDTTNLGEFEAGILVGRFNSGASDRRLIQQAIIQANDQLYYVLTMTSPAAKDAKGDEATDPTETAAVNSFRQMLDSVKLLDRSQVKDDQNERLFRTRALFVTLTPKRLGEAMVPEQWLRLIRDGKDVGYTYIVEEPDNKSAGDGLRIGIRSRSYPDANTQVDGETWFFMTGDRKHENWTNLVWIQDLKTKNTDQVTEFGSSDRQISRALDDSGKIQVGDRLDPKQPPVRVSESYALNVQTLAQKAAPPPVKRQLPPFYLPQALGHLMPRLVPLREPKTFLFATYVGDKREVMMRYVDVGTEQEVDLDGQRVRAIPVTDRLGLEGSPTIHYVSAQGKYLGSVNKDAKITILPTDAATLQKLWANKADLSRPRTVEQPAEPVKP